MTHLAWTQTYLQALCAHPQFAAARAVTPLWLAHAGDSAPVEHDEAFAPPAARLTIQMAAELFPRLVVIGPAGAGKTTLLRQLAYGQAEAILDRQRHGGRSAGGPALPLYVELARFEQSIEATLARSFDLGPPPALEELARERPLLLLLDGLDELAPDVQLASLSALAHTLATLGTQARWIWSCRSENLPLFRPWLGAAEVRSIRPLLPRDVIGTVQRQSGDDLAGWLQRAGDMVSLATRPRWLAALVSLALQPPYSRGGLLAAWLPAVIAATLEAHPHPAALEHAIEALPTIAALLDQHQRDTLSLAESSAAIAASQPGEPQATVHLLISAGILTLDSERQLLAFRHPALRSFGQALVLARTPPDQWPAAIFGRAWNDAVVFAYSLCANREAVLRRLLASGAVNLTARCLIDAEAPERFEALLTCSGTLTPPLRVMLADAFAAEGFMATALDQLERAGTEGYDEAGLFGRLGDLYLAAGQWHHARAAYEQALAREADDLRYRQQLGVVCSRLGELDQAAAALEAVLDAQQHRLAEAAHELGHVYVRQGRIECALAAYRQAATSRPGEPAYQRSVASALHRLGQIAEAEAVLQEVLAADNADADAYAGLGQLYADAGRLQEAIECYVKAVALRPAEADYYAAIGRLRRTLGDLSGARAALQRAAELDASDAALHFELGQACEACGEYEAALAAYRHAARLDPRSVAYQLRLGALLREHGYDDEAALVLRSVLDLRPDSAEAHGELAMLLWRQGSHEQALEAYRRALALDPHNAGYEHALGLAYRQSGQLRAAARHLQRAAELAPERADLHYDAATVAEALEHWDAALAAYERAAALDPAQPGYARAAGALHLRLGNRPRARTLLAHALWRDRHDAATLYQVGLLHSADAAWPRAIRALQRAIRAGRSAPHYFQLGRALAGAGRHAEARAAFEHALQICPDDANALYHYSLTLEACGQLGAAYDAARHAARLDSSRAVVQQHAGRLALRLGRCYEALALLDKAVALDSTMVAAHLDRGDALLMLEQPQAALACARAALALSPNLAAAALLAGQALIALGRDDEARAALEQAIELDARLLPAYAALRDLLAKTGAIAAALAAAQQAVALAPEAASHRLRLGELLLAAGDAAQAQAQLELALQLDPGLATAHARLSQIHIPARAWEQACFHAGRAVELAPEVADHHAHLAQALAGAGRVTEAIAAFIAATARAPECAAWQYELGQLHRRAGDDAAALPCLRRAALLAPDHADYHYAVGHCLDALGDRAGAVEALELALHLQPTAHLWRGELAAIQAARGWHGEALAELNQAIAAAPEHGHLWRLRAELYLQLNQPHAAQADLVEALRRDSQDATSFALLARIRYDHGDAAGALSAAQRAVALQPDDPRQRHLLAAALRALGRRAEAAEQLGLALARGGPGAWWTELADDYEALDSIDRAQEAWRQAIALAPEDAAVRYRYGCLLARSGALSDAIEQLQEAIARQPNYAAAHARLADVALAARHLMADPAPRHAGPEQDTGHQALLHTEPAAHAQPTEPMTLDEAVQSARRAVALQPQTSDHWRILGEGLWLQGSSVEASHALRRAHDLDPGNPTASFLLGLLALESGTAADAIAAFAAAAAAAPDVAACHACLAIAYRNTMTPPSDPDALRTPPPDVRLALDKARQALLRAIELEPATRRWWYELALVEQLLGAHDSAIQALDRWLELDEDQEPRTGDQAPRTEDQVAFAHYARRAAHYASRIARPVTSSEVRHRRALSLYAVGNLVAARADQEAAIAHGRADAASNYLLGRIAFDTGDLTTARTALAAAVSQAPDHGRAQFFLGRTLLALGQPADAALALERAAELDPADAGVAAALSDAYAASGRHERALAAAARAVRLDPSRAESHQRLASLYAAGGRLHEARAALINALSLRADVAAWHVQMAEICQQLGMPDAARSAYARAVELAPAETGYLYAYASLLARQGRPAEARAALEQALQRDPDRGAWHYELGRLHEHLGAQEAALEHYAAAVQRAPEEPAHWHALALAQHRRGERAIALETLERALERFGDVPELHAAAGRMLSEQAASGLAAWHFGIAAEGAPDVAEHWVRLGCARLELGDTEGARDALEQALARDPDAAEAHAALARIFAQAGDGRATLLHSQRAAELAPTEPAYQLQLAEAYEYLRRFDEAYQALARAVALLPEEPEVLARYGELALTVGFHREALDAFERAIEQRPDEPRYYYLAGKAHRRLKHYSRAIERFRRAIRLRPGYSEAIIELSTLGPLAFVAHHLRGSDADQAAA